MDRLQLPANGRFIHSVGQTPLVPLALSPEDPPIWCKLEFLNPSGSVKDRVARYMLEKAWRRGAVRAGSTVIEASSGSTSIALALACAQLGLRFVAVMPEGVSGERQLIIRAFGGSITLTPRAAGMAGALERAREIAAATGAHETLQFENPDNVEAHRVSTGQEILAQVPAGIVHAVVSGVGTGGTIVGLYEAFRAAGCACVPAAARPVTGTSIAEAECSSFSQRIPGVVEGLSRLYAEARLEGLIEVPVADDTALATTRALMARGFPVGPSSGLNYAAAATVARRLGGGATVVTLFPDRMERYFSTELFHAWPERS